MSSVKPLIQRACTLATVALLIGACAGGGAESPQGTPGWREPLTAPPPPANQPPAGSPAFFARAAQDRAWAEGRGRDQAVNPAYLAATAPPLAAFIASGGADQSIQHDPFRLEWEQTRGQALDVSFANRYGAQMRAKLWMPRLPTTDPVSGVVHSGPLPALIFVPGAALPAPDSTYRGFVDYEAQLQQLAEGGYLILAVGPQGQEGSEYFVPPHPLCDPEGAWRRPQEFGLIELGTCAGQDGPLPTPAGEYRAVYESLVGLGDPLGAAPLLQGQLEDEAAVNAFFVAATDAIQNRFIFAALDAVGFLLSADNPWRGFVDDRRIGALGHSAGGHAALVAANGDPLRRFAAAVSWDSYGAPPASVLPRVPTMLHQGEDQNLYGPFTAPRANEVYPPYRNYRRFAEAGVDGMLLALRGSTHNEWYYTAYALVNPLTPLFNASALGGQVSHYFTLAWFDRWLKGMADPLGKASAQSRHARARLLARRFDDSADRSSIGAGSFDPATARNRPYQLAGLDIDEHLSVFYLSQLAFDGFRCEDVQAGCAEPPEARR